MTYLEMDKKLEKILDEKRYIHSKGVEEVAVALAEIWGADVINAKIAGLLHDNAKNLNKSILEKNIKEITEDSAILEAGGLWHGPVGAKLLQEEYGVKNEDIYNAIYFHSTGRKNMSLLERIIYISDLIEPTRDLYFDWAESCRELAMENLDMALIKVTDKLLAHLNSKGAKIHPAIYDVRSDAEKRLNNN